MLDKTSSIICAFGLAAAAPRSPYRHLELCGIAIKIITCSSVSPFGSLHFRKAVFLLPALSPSLPVSRMHMILFVILYIIYKLFQFVSFVLFLQRRRFLAILFAFFVYFYVLSRILGEFFVQNKTRNTKRRIFLFFSSVVRKFLSISLFPLCPLFFVTALSPGPPKKPQTDFFTAQHFSLNSAEENSHFAVCFARSRFRTESFFLPN